MREADPDRARLGFSPLIFLPALPIALILVSAWPGYLSFDSALQFYQARSWTFFDIAPPLLPLLWGLLLRLGLPECSGPLLLIGLSYAGGFALLVRFALIQRQSGLAWLLALLGPLCPLLLLLLAQIWTDVLLAGFLLSAVGLLLNCPVPRLTSGMLIGGLLLLATGLRHNSVLAVLPIVCCWVWRWWPSRSRWFRGALSAVLLLAFWLAKSLLASVLVQQKLDTWALVPLFDLQAVSVATAEQRLPASVVGPGMDVAQLQRAFHPYSVTTLFSGTTSGVSDPTVGPLSTQQATELRAAWRRLPLEPAWWAHRWRLFRGLLGSHRAPELAGLADSPALAGYADNPPLARAFPAVHDLYRSALGALRNSWAYAPGLYLLLGLLGAALLQRAKNLHAWNAVGLCLLTSAWLYTLPYFLIAPSAETRYVLWPALASWLIWLLALAGRRRSNPDVL